MTEGDMKKIVTKNMTIFSDLQVSEVLLFRSMKGGDIYAIFQGRQGW